MKVHQFFKNLKVLFLATLLFLLYACAADEPGKIEFDEDASLLALEESEKNELYQKLDALESYEGDDSPPIDSYSQIRKVKDDEHYYQLLEESNKRPILLMFAQDECPQCKVFVPKLNQLSKELEIVVYYYDTQARIYDEDFSEIIANFDIQTVPHSFIIDQEKLIGKINHLSSMEEIENFLYQVQ